MEEVLWAIFTHYTLVGNPRDPSRLNNTGLLKLCKDVMIMDPMMAENYITQADVRLIYTSVKKHTITSKHLQKANSSSTTQVVMDKGDKLNFEEFVSCLLKIAQKCYPSSSSKDEAMQQLLMDNVLPLANKRILINISNTVLKQPNMESIYTYYEDALKELFSFFASASENSLHGKNMIISTCSTGKTFDEHAELIEEAKLRTQVAQPQSKNMSYSSFIMFAADFGLLSSSLNLTNMELGDIYLTTIAFSNFKASVRKIDFKEFWECIVRCALQAFKDHAALTSDQKVKELLLHMWRHTQADTQSLMRGYGTLQGGGFNTHKGTLLKVSQAFSEKFTIAWAKDDYRDYLVGVSNLPLPAVTTTSASGSSTESKLPDSGTPFSGTKTAESGGALFGMFSPLPRFINQLIGDGKGSTISEASQAQAAAATATTVQSSSSSSSSSLQLEHSVSDLLHSKIEQRTDYLISTADILRSDRAPVSIRVQIDDSTDKDLAQLDCASSSLRASNIRKLLYLNPHIALILHDCILEEGLASNKYS